MRHRTLFALSTLVCLLSSARARAQDELPRARLTGVAKLADGSPWAGARVTAREQGASLFAAEAIDARESTTDAQGHFSLELLDGRPYALWASAAAAEGGTRWSEVHLDARGGARVDLEAEGDPRNARTLRFDDPRFADGSAYRFELREREISRRTVGTTGKASSITLPGGPRTDGTLIVTDQSGSLVLRVELGAELDGDGSGTLVVHPSAPRCVRVRVAEPGDKLPLAAARIGTVIDGLWFDLATTGADGTAIVDAAFDFARLDDEEELDDTDPASLYVRAPGHHLGLLSLTDVPPRARDEVDEEVGASCHPTKLEVAQCILRLTLDGQPLPGVALNTAGTAWENADDDTLIGTEVELELAADSDGRIDLTGLRDGDEPIELCLSSAIVAALPALWRRGLPQTVPVFLDPDQVTQSFALDLRRDLRPVDFELLAAGDGAPVASGQVVLATADDHVGSPFTSDRTGHLRTLLPVHTHCRIQFGHLSPQGFTAIELEPAALAENPDVPLRVRPKLSVPVRIDVTVKAAVDLVAETTISINAYVVDPPERPDQPPTPSSAPFRTLDHADAIHFTQHLSFLAERWGADLARRVLFVPPLECTLEIGGSMMVDDSMFANTMRLPITGTDKTIAAELELIRQ